MHANLFDSGRGRFEYVTDEEALKACFEVSRLEGIIPALETAHAFAVLKNIELTKEDIVVINLSGRGDKDLSTLIKYM
jgi:tryptophan synthase beta chain